MGDVNYIYVFDGERDTRGGDADDEYGGLELTRKHDCSDFIFRKFLI